MSRLFRSLIAAVISRPMLTSWVCTLVLGVALLASAQPRSAFTVGVLRRDATVVPFATYDGRSWKNYWPEPSQSVEVPLNLRSVPRKWWGPLGPLGEWQVWAGPTPRNVRVRQPDWLLTHCQKQVGLRTDYQPSERPPGDEAQPYPKDGLALSPPHPVQPVERLAPDSGDGRTMLELLRRGFADREEAAVSRAIEAGADVRPTKDELEALPITIEALYAGGTTPRAFYVEATREYRKGSACAVLFGSGWVVVNTGTITYAGLEVQMAPCDRTGIEYMLPLGLMSLPGGVYWIAQWSNFDREEYAIVEIRANGIVAALAVAGGTC